MPLWQNNKKTMPTSRLEEIGKIIVHSAYKVHKELGPGLLERIYEVCLAYEIEKAGLKVERQVPATIFYDNLEFDEGFKMDLLVEDSVVIELKAVEKVNPVWAAQIISHLYLTQNKLGYLINFNVPLIKEGIKRYINTKQYLKNY